MQPLPSERQILASVYALCGVWWVRYSHTESQWLEEIEKFSLGRDSLSKSQTWENSIALAFLIAKEIRLYCWIMKNEYFCFDRLKGFKVTCSTSHIKTILFCSFTKNTIYLWKLSIVEKMHFLLTQKMIYQRLYFSTRYQISAYTFSNCISGISYVYTQRSWNCSWAH